ATSRACVVLDVGLLGISGMELLIRLRDCGSKHVVVVITGHGDVPMAVAAMRAGAFHFAEKPFDPDAFVSIVMEALARVEKLVDTLEHARESSKRYAHLSAPEKQVLQLLVGSRTGKPIPHYP